MKKFRLRKVLMVLLIMGACCTIKATDGCKYCLRFQEMDNSTEYLNVCYGVCTWGSWFCGSLWTCLSGNEICAIKTYCPPNALLGCETTAYPRPTIE
jgi:hypothetical protein